MKQLSAITIVLSLATCFGASSSSTGSLSGKCGAELKMAVRESFRPTGYITSQEELWRMLRQIDLDPEGRMADRFSNSSYDLDGQPDHPVPGLGSVTVADRLWWSKAPDLQDAISRDLHNIVPCNFEVAANKRHYPPFEPVTPLYTNGTWQAGTTMLGSTEINAWCPPEKYRGDFARIIMYMISVYDPGSWDMCMSGLLRGQSYPTLSPAFATILIRWHREDPVSAEETARSAAISSVQGHGNPFVAHPDLAEHIWGEHSTSPWGVQPDDKEEVQPLRASYTADDTIWFTSPYIPASATWEIDGKPVTTASVQAAEIGRGEHELRYRTPQVRGKLKITIL